MTVFSSRAARCAAVGCALAALVSACSSPPKNVQKTDYSGFLSDYSRLQPAQSPSGTPVMRWISPQLSQGGYDKVYLEPPVLYLGKGQEPTKNVSRQTMDEIVAYFGNAQRELLQRHGALASKPGPRTLRVRTAITAVREHEQALKPYEYIPVALAFAAAESASGKRKEDTTVYIEGEASDSQTGELLAEVARQDAGPPLPNADSKVTLQDIQPLLDKWAMEFYRQLESLTKVP